MNSLNFTPGKTPRLVIVEGIPGSGKTSVARFASGWLEKQGLATALYLEGDLDHPADFESVARLDAQQLAALQARFPGQAAWLAGQVDVQGESYLVSYHKLQRDFKNQAPDQLFAALQRYDLYEQPLEVFQPLVLQRWRAFVQNALQDKKVYLFECCFLQNPLTMLIGRNNAGAQQASSFILEIAAAIQALNPLLIYLLPPSASQALQHVAAERPPEWLDFVIHYHTEQGYGLAHGLSGAVGLVKFYEMRQALEMSLLPRLPMHTCLVEHVDWERTHRQIQDFLGVNFRTWHDSN